METEKIEKRERNGNGKIINWNWINIISFFVVQALRTLYNEAPCTQHRWSRLHIYSIRRRMS